MSLEAIALLRLSDHEPLEGAVVLRDAVLLRTGSSFASEPGELVSALRRMIGAALERHDDARGVFFVPAVALEAARAAGSYAAVLEAIGEAGMWVPLVEEVATARPTMVEQLAQAGAGSDDGQAAMRASLAQLAEQLAAGGDDELEGEGTSPGAQMPLDVMALLQDPAMMALAQRMRDLAPPDAAADGDDAGDDDDDEDFIDEATDPGRTELDGALPADLAALMSSPAFAEMLKNAQAVLAQNPEQAAQLAARLGFTPPEPEDDDDEE